MREMTNGKVRAKEAFRTNQKEAFKNDKKQI
jgi:hypothetical protein